MTILLVRSIAGDDDDERFLHHLSASGFVTILEALSSVVMSCSPAGLICVNSLRDRPLYSVGGNRSDAPRAFLKTDILHPASSDDRLAYLLLEPEEQPDFTDDFCARLCRADQDLRDVSRTFSEELSRLFFRARIPSAPHSDTHVPTRLTGSASIYPLSHQELAQSLRGLDTLCAGDPALHAARSKLEEAMAEFWTRAQEYDRSCLTPAGRSASGYDRLWARLEQRAVNKMHASTPTGL